MTDETQAAIAFMRAFFADLYEQNARDYETRYLPIQVNEESRAWVRGHIIAWESAAKMVREIEFRMPAKAPIKRIAAKGVTSD